MQNKKQSMTETITNVVLGIVIAMTITQAYADLSHSIVIDLTHNVYLTAMITVGSLLRTYVVRRFFNKLWR